MNPTLSNQPPARHRWWRTRPGVLLGVALAIAAGAGEARGQAGAALGSSGAMPRTSSVAESFVRPGDNLRIVVWPDAELGGEFPVEETGYVYLPVLGRVQAAGVPLDQLREQLRMGYSDAMKTPVVTITPLFRVSVLGAVMRPGLYVADPTHTLFDLISMAGGFSADADQEKIRIVGERGVQQVNGARTLREGEPANPIVLQSGDRVVVPGRRGGITREAVQGVLFALQAVVLLVSLVR